MTSYEIFQITGGFSFWIIIWCAFYIRFKSTPTHLHIYRKPRKKIKGTGGRGFFFKI